MIAPFETKRTASDTSGVIRQGTAIDPTELPAGADQPSAATRLVTRYPLVSATAAVAVGIAVGWLVKHRRGA